MERLTTEPPENDLIRVLHNPSFFFLMISEFFSQLAFNMQHFVFIFIIYNISHSNTAVSGIILSFTIPAIIFSISAGVYVDRWEKRNVLFITNLMRGILLLFFLIPHLHLAFIYTLTFFIAIITQFFLPAESAIIPLLVKKNQLVSANSVFAIGIYSTILLGYIAAGPSLLLLGKNWVFIFLSILFFISAGCVLLISIPKLQEKKEEKGKNIQSSFTKDIQEVFSFIKVARVVTQALTILTISQAILFMFAVLGPGYVATVLDVEVESLSWILLAPAALGMIIGSIYVGSFGKKLRAKRLIACGFLFTGLIFLILPLGSRVESQGIILWMNTYLPHVFDITNLHIIVILAFLAGIANSLIFIPANTVVQRNTSEAMRGRIYGVYNALTGAVSLFPVIIAGGLADILGVARVIVGIGILLLVLSVSAFTLKR